MVETTNQYSIVKTPSPIVVLAEIERARNGMLVD